MHPAEYVNLERHGWHVTYEYFSFHTNGRGFRWLPQPSASWVRSGGWCRLCLKPSPLCSATVVLALWPAFLCCPVITKNSFSGLYWPLPLLRSTRAYVTLISQFNGFHFSCWCLLHPFFTLYHEQETQGYLQSWGPLFRGAKEWLVWVSHPLHRWVLDSPGRPWVCTSPISTSPKQLRSPFLVKPGCWLTP